MGLRHGRRTPDGCRSSRTSGVYSCHRGRAAAHRQPPALVRHVRAGPGRHHGLFVCVPGTREAAGHFPEADRRPHAVQLPAHRRRPERPVRRVRRRRAPLPGRPGRQTARVSHPVHRQPHFRVACQGHRRAERGRRHQIRRQRAGHPRLGRALRRAQGASVQRLPSFRLRHPHRQGRRRVLALSRADAGVLRIHRHRPPSPGPDSGRRFHRQGPPPHAPGGRRVRPRGVAARRGGRVHRRPRRGKRVAGALPLPRASRTCSCWGPWAWAAWWRTWWPSSAASTS